MQHGRRDACTTTHHPSQPASGGREKFNGVGASHGRGTSVGVGARRGGPGFANRSALHPGCHAAEVEPEMNEHEFQSKLAELMGEISTLPPTERNKLEKLATETRARHERLRQTVSGLQESLDSLRLSIKYLVFDLEATRRENGYLRKMLEEKTGGAE